MFFKTSNISGYRKTEGIYHQRNCTVRHAKVILWNDEKLYKTEVGTTTTNASHWKWQIDEIIFYYNKGHPKQLLGRGR